MNGDEIPNRVDGVLGTELTSPTCRHCRHCRHLISIVTHTCTAFPEGIPDELWWSYQGHREPFPGDRGIQFSQIELPSPLRADRYEIPEFLKVKRSPPEEK